MTERYYVVYNMVNQTKMMEIYDDTILGDVVSSILIEGIADNIQVLRVVDRHDCECRKECTNE